MPVSNVAMFTQTTRRLNAIVTAAKTTYGDLANAVLLGTTGPNGGIIVHASAMPRATVTLSQLLLILSDGTNHYIVGSAQMAAYTMATTTAVPATPILIGGRTITDENPAQLPASAGGTTWSLYAASGVALAAGIAVGVEVLDY